MSKAETKRVPVGNEVHVETFTDGTPVNRPVRFTWGNAEWLLTSEMAERIGNQLLEAARLARQLQGDPPLPSLRDRIAAEAAKPEAARNLGVKPRAPVQGEYKRGGRKPGTIDWEEHELAWSGYHAECHNDQDAARIAARGGFGYDELVRFLGREPTTWQPKE